MTPGIKFLENLQSLNPIPQIQLIYNKKSLIQYKYFGNTMAPHCGISLEDYSFSYIFQEYILYNSKIVCWRSSCVKYFINYISPYIYTYLSVVN